MAISPDGSFIVIGGQGADNPPNCDSVLRYETAGNSVTPFTWSARFYSSVFSLAVSDQAVYVGGHFCAAPRLGAVYPGGLTSDFTGTANGCDFGDENDPINPSERDPVNAVFRNQGLAALDPVTAQAFPWNPGSDNDLAVFDLTVIDRGLLAGHDGSRFNEFLVGRSGFFDLGAPADDQAPTVVVSSPTAGAFTGSLTSLTGTAGDNFDVSSVTIRLRNITTNQWLQLNGALGGAQVDLPVTLTQTAIGQYDWSVPVNNLPPGNYEVRGFSTDPSGNTSTPLAHPFTVPGGQQCSVALNANDQPVITYTGFSANGVSNIVVRRDGGYLADAPDGNGTFTDTGASPGSHSYLLRWRPNGVVDVPCTPASITVPQPGGGGGGGAPCTVAINGAGDPVLTWAPVAGVNTYVIREADLGFIATVNGSNSFTDTGRADGDYSYLIRVRPPGAGVVDLACTPNPITVGGGGGGGPIDPPPTGCTATVAGNGNVDLAWAAIPNENLYQVRDNGGFVATAGNVLAFTDTSPTSGSQTYVIRSRQGNFVNDVVCNTVNVP